MTVIVSAAVVEEGGRFLVTRRQKGVHLEGFWEFPGGKCDPGESLDGCLARELAEELGVAAVVSEEMLVTRHEYPDRSVELHFFRCQLLGRPSPQVGQDMRWVTRDELGRLRLPPADVELVRLLADRP